MKLFAIEFRGATCQTFVNSQFSGHCPELNADYRLNALHDYRGRTQAVGWLGQIAADHFQFWVDDPATIAHIITLLTPGAQLSRVTLHQLDTPYYLTQLPQLTEHGFTIQAQNCQTQHTHAISQDQWLTWCIQSGLPMLRENTWGEFTANMLGLIDHGAVDLHKGCFVGYEVIARAHHLGAVKRACQHGHLQLGNDANLDTPQPGENLAGVDDSSITGRVILSHQTQCLVVAPKTAQGQCLAWPGGQIQLSA